MNFFLYLPGVGGLGSGGTTGGFGGASTIVTGG